MVKLKEVRFTDISKMSKDTLFVVKKIVSLWTSWITFWWSGITNEDLRTLTALYLNAKALFFPFECVCVCPIISQGAELGQDADNETKVTGTEKGQLLKRFAVTLK